jgi:putative ABC transport system permease protein
VSRLSLDGMNVPAVGYEPGRGDVGLTIIRGRAPGDGEIALGRRTLSQLGVGLGDTVTARFGDTTRVLRVVGRSVLPGFGTYEGSDKTELGAGAVVSLNDLLEVAPDFGHYLYLVRAQEGTPPSALRARVVGGFNPDDVRTIGVQRPAEIANYGRLRTTPLVLAGVLAGLAVATVTHALVASVRRRRRDFAILKTLGFARRQVSATVAWQASTLLVIALAVGLPLGVAAGRWAWTVVAEQLGTTAEPVTPLLVVLLTIPAGLLLANLVAALPARVASRLKPATVLRSE